MKQIRRKIGLYGFTLCLSVFFSLLFLGNFTLTEDKFEKAVTGYTESGKPDYEILEPYFEDVFNQSFISSFSFNSAISERIAQANKHAGESGNTNQIIKSNYNYVLTKAATSGWLAAEENQLLLFILCFVLCPLFGVLYFYSFYVTPTNGIKNNGIYTTSSNNKGWVAYLVFGLFIGFYCLLYFAPQYMTNWIILVDPISKALTGGEASEWFLYGFIYCTIMVTMGLRMLWKYKGNNYQMLRTGSVVFFQVVFAFLLPNLVKELHGHDLKHIWPLDYTYFDTYKMQEHLGPEAPTSATTVYLWGLALFLIGVPVFTYYFGKRWYCSWVCGCGGLAETLGDPFRQHSSKKLSAWKLERWLIHGVLIFAFVMTLLLLLAYFGLFDPGAAGFVKYIYGFFIGSLFSGVIGTGFYPVLGSRVWCRFGCPLAAYIGIWQRKKSKFRITTNGSQCISCGNCSTYCEMGIDVRWYAQRGQNIVRSSCVGCGVCSSVCPRGVLKLENGPTENRINENPSFIGLKNLK